MIQILGMQNKSFYVYCFIRIHPTYYKTIVEKLHQNFIIDRIASNFKKLYMVVKINLFCAKKSNVTSVYFM